MTASLCRVFAHQEEDDIVVGVILDALNVEGSGGGHLDPIRGSKGLRAFGRKTHYSPRKDPFIKKEGRKEGRKGESIPSSAGIPGRADGALADGRTESLISQFTRSVGRSAVG